jgi:hypothetical protein
MKYNKLKTGKRYVAKAPNGEDILGTYERVTARAEIAFFMKGGEVNGMLGDTGMDHGVDYEHAGGSEIFWDGMETVQQLRQGPNGDPKDPKPEDQWTVYLCSAGEEWTVDQLEFEEIE